MQLRVNTNKYIFKVDHIEIYTIKNQIIFIDLEDYELIKNYSWYVSSKGYAYSKKDKKHISMHRLIMNPGKFQIDHINHNKLDNRKSNLRISTNQENQFNRLISKNNKSGYNGVYFNSQCGKWCAQLKINGECVLNKLFLKIEDAVTARKKAENKYFKYARK